MVRGQDGKMYYTDDPMEKNQIEDDQPTAIKLLPKVRN